MKFNEEYYKSGNYVNYLSKSERYYKLSEEIFDLLNKIGFSEKNYKILDYGCALGFLLDGIKKLGYFNLYGFDISEWATKEFLKKHKSIDLSIDNNFDICFVLDVFEHMTDDEIDVFFSKIKSNLIVYRIPISNNKGKNFVLDVSNNDPTHINCKERENWIDLFKQYGYNFNIKLNLKTIYDSEGVMCGIIFKN